MEQQKPILIYYRARGNCQVIRGVLLYMGVQFEEVFVDCGGNIPYELTDLGYHFTREGLPYLIHGGLIINDVFPILKYLCVRFGHPQLLGNNLHDSIRIAEIIVKFMREKSKMFVCLFRKIHEFCNANSQSENCLIEIKKWTLSALKSEKYYQACFKMYVKTANFVFGYLTILDFIFYESCFYCVNMFSDFPEEVAVPTLYKNFFQQTNFYKKNKQKLESYYVFMPQFDFKTNQLLKRLWVGEEKYFNNQAKTQK